MQLFDTCGCKWGISHGAGGPGRRYAPSRKCPSRKNEISVEHAALAICREARDFVHALCFGNLRQLIKLRLFKAVAVAVPTGSMLPAKQVIVVFKLGCIKTGKRGAHLRARSCVPCFRGQAFIVHELPERDGGDSPWARRLAKPLHERRPKFEAGNMVQKAKAAGQVMRAVRIWRWRRGMFSQQGLQHITGDEMRIEVVQLFEQVTGMAGEVFACIDADVVDTGVGERLC